jgi:TetR/AcrR family transcriptional repressor of nem operon
MPRKKLFNEEEVLQKAMILFWEKGYHNTSMQDLVDRLEINRASLYDTYGGKKKIFISALEEYLRNGREKMEQTIETNPGAEKTFRQLLETIIEHDHNDMSHKGCLVANSTTELITDHPDINEIITNYNKYIEESFYKILLQGVQAGEIDENKDLKSVAHLMNLVVTGLRVLGKTKPEKEETLAVVNVVLSLLK